MDCHGGFSPAVGYSCQLPKATQFHVIVLPAKWSKVHGIELNPRMSPVIRRTVRKPDH